MPVMVASDLDRTLIYSAAALALTGPDASPHAHAPAREVPPPPRLLCVEIYENKPLSYMTETAARLLTDLADPAWVRKHRVAEDLFAYLVVERELLPEDWVKELAVWAENRGWTVSLQGRKLYAVPQPLTKSAAVREVAGRTGADLVLGAGDSLLDADLLLAVDRGWRPGHGELADTGWTAPGVAALPERGVAAGERIVREFLGAARAHR
jgi:hypothetical protein